MGPSDGERRRGIYNNMGKMNNPVFCHEVPNRLLNLATKYRGGPLRRHGLDAILCRNEAFGW